MNINSESAGSMNKFYKNHDLNSLIDFCLDNLNTSNSFDFCYDMLTLIKIPHMNDRFKNFLESLEKQYSRKNKLE